MQLSYWGLTVNSAELTLIAVIGLMDGSGAFSQEPSTVIQCQVNLAHAPGTIMPLVELGETAVVIFPLLGKRRGGPHWCVNMEV